MKIIFTNNALNKIHRDNLSQKIIYDTISNASRTYPGREPGVTQYIKNWDFGTVTAIVKKTDRGELLVITCFAKYNQAKFYKKPDDPRYKNASFFTKLWLDIIKLFGL